MTPAYDLDEIERLLEEVDAFRFHPLAADKLAVAARNALPAMIADLRAAWMIALAAEDYVALSERKASLSAMDNARARLRIRLRALLAARKEGRVR